jgi:hypothetical protein
LEDVIIINGSLLQTVQTLSPSFSMTAQLPDQDVFGDDQTELDGAQTQIL